MAKQPSPKQEASSETTSAKRLKELAQDAKLYLKGVSTGEMGEALKVLVGHDAQGLSASTVSRLKSEWANEYQHWRESPLGVDRCAYIWADGIYSGLRSEKDKLCALVIHWSQRKRSETFFSHRRWCTRVHSELERDSAETQKPWHECSSVSYW